VDRLSSKPERKRRSKKHPTKRFIKKYKCNGSVRVVISRAWTTMSVIGAGLVSVSASLWPLATAAAAAAEHSRGGANPSWIVAVDVLPAGVL